MEVSNSFSVLFFPRTSNLDKLGRATIFFRITVDGKRSEVSVKRKTYLEDWCPISNKVKGFDHII